MGDRNKSDVIAIDDGSTRWATAAGALVPLGSFANFLDHNDYPLLRAEVLILVLVLLGAALLVGLVYRASGRAVRVALEGLLAYLAADLNLDSSLAALGCAVAAVVVGTALRRSVMPLLALIFAVTLVSSLLPSRQPAWARSPNVASAKEASAPPFLLHLILDSHIGIEGLEDMGPEGAALSRHLKDMLVGAGFRVVGGAYSENLQTVNAIPRILNFGVAPPIPRSRKDTGIAVTANAYFSAIQARGYRLRVVQSDWVDYCRHPAVDACKVYSATGIASIADSELTVVERSKLIARVFARLSELAVTGTAIYDWQVMKWRSSLPPSRLNIRANVGSLGALQAFEALTADLEKARPGEAYFAHLLFPHAPFIVDGQCRQKPLEAWEYRDSLGELDGQEAAYLEQTRCVGVLLRDALEGLARSPAGDGAVVVVHGDHGSRLSSETPMAYSVGRFDRHDLIAGHSSLFAIRSPSISPGYVAKMAPMPALLEAASKSSFRSINDAETRHYRPTVMLADRRWIPVRLHDLPAFDDSRAPSRSKSNAR